MLALIQGMVRHIQCTPREIEAYITHLEKVMRCYVQRLQWLLSGEPACYPGGRTSAMGSGRATPGTPGSVLLPRLGTHRLSPRGNMTSGFRGQARCWMTGRWSTSQSSRETQAWSGRSASSSPTPRLLGVTEGLLPLGSLNSVLIGPHRTSP